MSLATLDAATLYGLMGAVLVGIGLYGIVLHDVFIRRLLAFNLLGGGVFILFGVIARRGAGAGFPGDPVPQALVITGVVVAFCATALAITLIERLAAKDEASDGDDHS
ncbi:NADH-quinone oxidoreductase subunit K [Mesorhizobium sp. BR1-1-16]|uniref:NADH-quinone oxidoreductase subunit K n=1 Tax=Mesorhizobium sp. BR1-1-16 TaxID=2876653 RepID=UPI001CD02488|nr:NADH-quinone oxidoreductase subunit K [Mesorhizobium sp. BR1-1-16]MBZ9935527.1 NADH-quinone oxidoreductase subunit K [Mesorhizobium sp. BR1-1-16]